jgi:hypothetical protein
MMLKNLILSCFLGVVVASCGGTTQPPAGTGPGTNEDPCAGKALPACPRACAEPPGAMDNKPCATEGEACGNNVGDGCKCTGGKWACEVHAPLRPDTCNQVCKDQAPAP